MMDDLSSQARSTPTNSTSRNKLPQDSDTLCADSDIQSRNEPRFGHRPQNSESQMALTEDQKRRLEISQQDFTEVWGGQNPDAVAHIYADEFQGHGFPLGQTVDKAEYRSLAKWFQAAFPGCSITPTDLRVDEDFVYAEWEFSGTHSGWLFGVPPSGAAVTFAGTGRHAHRDGYVQEIWMDVDWSTIVKQVLAGYLD